MIPALLVGLIVFALCCLSRRPERRALDAMPVGVGRVALDESILWANPALRSMWGGVPGTWSEITHPDDLEEDRARVRELILGGADSYAMAKRYRRPDGRGHFWARLTVAIVRSPWGAPSHFLVTVTPLDDAMADVRRREHSDAFGELRLAAKNFRDALGASGG